jgi:hypothetical protein
MLAGMFDKYSVKIIKKKRKEANKQLFLYLNYDRSSTELPDNLKALFRPVGKP